MTIHGLIDDNENPKEPSEVTWFTEEGYDVIDVEAGSKGVLVKVKCRNTGEYSLFGIHRYYTPEEKEENEGKDTDKIVELSKEMIGFEQINLEKSKG